MTYPNENHRKVRALSGVSITYAYVLSFVLALLPTTSLGGSKGEKSNDLAIEFLGRCGRYSVSYQRLIDKLVGLEASTSVISESGSVLAYFAGGFRAYLSSSDASGFVVGGLAVASQGGGYLSSRLFSRWSSTT